MPFPDPYQVAKIAALLRKNEGWYETIDEAHTLLLKAEEYCRDYRIKACPILDILWEKAL